MAAGADLGYQQPQQQQPGQGRRPQNYQTRSQSTPGANSPGRRAGSATPTREHNKQNVSVTQFNTK